MAANFDCPLEELKEYEDMQEAIRQKRGPLLVSGCVDSQKVQLACRLAEGSPLSLIVTYNDSRAKEICEDARCFADPVLYYPAKDLLFYQADIHGSLLVQRRMEVWKQMLEEGRGVIVTTVDGCMEDVYKRQAETSAVHRLLLWRRVSLKGATPWPGGPFR